MLNAKVRFIAVSLCVHFATVGSVVCVPPSVGQVPVPDSLQAAIAQLVPGNHLRLSLRDAGRVQGVYLGQTALGVTIDGSSQPLAFSSIDSLWVRGHSAGKGAWIGAVLGGLLGAIVLASAEESACSGPACNVAGHAAIGALGGAAGGALVGAGVGLVLPQWKRRFP